MCLLKGDEPEKELPPAVTTKKQPPAQVTAAPAAAVQPVKAAAVEVSAAHTTHWHSVSA